MQVRVFEATDMASGLKMVKKELGPNALILSTRTVRGGKFGLVGKPVLEITAAIDADYPQGQHGPSQDQPAPAPGTRRTTGFRGVVDDSVDEFLLQQTAATAADHRPTDRIQENRGVAAAAGAQPDLQNEVNELKDLVKNLAGKIADLAEKEQSPKNPSPPNIKTPGFANRRDSAAIHGDGILSLLIARGINVEASRTIAGFLRESLTDQEQGDSQTVMAAILATIEKLIQVDPPAFARRSEQQRLALVGPTGVGKTTTLAKIAAAYLSRYSNSIALITIDTYRIAAVEQLKVYGEIMHLPVDVVITPDQLKKAIDRHADKELILIDTAGRSPRDSFCIDELAAFLRPELNIDKHLVLSATTRELELLDAIERFQSLGITHTIFTKIDECANLGILLNVQLQNANPLSYLTNGQRVPEDLLEASPKIAAELIMAQQEGSLHD